MYLPFIMDSLSIAITQGARPSPWILLSGPLQWRLQKDEWGSFLTFVQEDNHLLLVPWLCMSHICLSKRAVSCLNMGLYSLVFCLAVCMKHQRRNWKWSVSRVLAVQAWGPEFISSTHMKWWMWDPRSETSVVMGRCEQAHPRSSLIGQSFKTPKT